MSEQMDVDDYPRTDERSRSRSPRRERSPTRGSFDRGDRGDRSDRRDRDRGSYKDRYAGRVGGNDRRHGTRDRYTGSASSGGGGGGRGRYPDDPARFSSNGAYADKSNRNYAKSIFIGNLPFDCTWDQLKEHFQSVGEVTRADIVTSRGQSRGMGTVEFRNEEDVFKAIDQYNHTTFLQREIFVRQDNPPPEKRDSGRDRFSDGGYGRDRERGDRGRDRDSYRSGGRDRYSSRDTYSGVKDSFPDSRSGKVPPKGYEVFVGNLPFRTNWQDLKDLFRDAGNVVHADVRLDDQGRSKGFGIVTYATREEASAAVDQFQGFQLEGRTIDVRDGKNNARLDEEKLAGEAPLPGGFQGSTNDNSGADDDQSDFCRDVVGNGEKSDTVFVGNLPFSTFNEDLYDLFEGVGAIVKAEIQKSGGRPKGSGVVRFENESDAQVAIDQLNGYNYGGRELRISYASYSPQ